MDVQKQNGFDQVIFEGPSYTTTIDLTPCRQRKTQVVLHHRLNIFQRMLIRLLFGFRVKVQKRATRRNQTQHTRIVT